MEGFVEAWIIKFDSTNWLNGFFYVNSTAFSASIRYVNFDYSSEGLAKHFSF